MNDDAKRGGTPVRLDKFFSSAGLLTRRETAIAVRRGEILQNGLPVSRPDIQVEPETDRITLRGEPVVYRKHVYLFLHKPAGYVSATEDGRFPVVTDLLPEAERRRGLFPCGRLDKDTTGLMLLTDDGALCHALLSPRHGVGKIYRFLCDLPLPPEAEKILADGLTLANGETCRAALLQADDDRLGGYITLTEGKYHEVRRLVAALGSHVTSLCRVSFAGIALDPALAPGEFRSATEEELEILHAAVAKKPTK